MCPKCSHVGPTVLTAEEKRNNFYMTMRVIHLFAVTHIAPRQCPRTISGQTMPWGFRFFE